MDQGRRNVELAVGDKVYLNLQPYRQWSLATHVNEKFCPQYFGPFPIVQHIRQVAYKLQLPSTSSIHLVFHVLQLKLALGPDVVSQPPPPALNHDIEWGMEPWDMQESEKGRMDRRCWFSGSTYLILKALGNLHTRTKSIPDLALPLRTRSYYKEGQFLSHKHIIFIREGAMMTQIIYVRGACDNVSIVCLYSLEAVELAASHWGQCCL